MREPLQIAEQGQFWVGVSRGESRAGTLAGAAMYVWYQIPARATRPYPLVLAHGGGGQGTDWLGTPDGRPGWATRFLERGHAVHVVDRPGYGRSPHNPQVSGPPGPAPTYERMSAMFSAPALACGYPQAARHTQWPGDGGVGDPALDQFMAAQAGFVGDMAASHAAMRECAAALLDRIGPAVLMTHSMGGAFGWLAADARPGLVRGIVAVEPAGPPFADLPAGALSWGLTAVPLAFDPPAAAPSDLARELRPAPRPGLVDCYVQREPARRLPRLSGFPIAVVTSEASWMAQDNHGVVDFLAQAGADVEHLRLEERGVRGNGHLMMGEKNSDEVARVVADWMEARVG